MLILNLLNSDGTVETCRGPVPSLEAVISRLPTTVPHITNRFPADNGCYEFTEDTVEVSLFAGRGGTAIFLHMRYFYF